MKLEVLWRQLAGIGAEHLVLKMNGGIHADSLAVGEIEGSAYRIRYEIDCDAAWNVQRLRIEDLLSGKVLALRRAAADRWGAADGKALVELDGCTEVDIMITPFTNTLPIRRLNLKPGEARQITVIYVSVPGLEVSRAKQQYTCLSLEDSGGVYRYESLKSGFTAELKADMDGLVVDYPSIFAMDAKRPLSG